MGLLFEKKRSCFPLRHPLVVVVAVVVVVVVVVFVVDEVWSFVIFWRVRCWAFGKVDEEFSERRWQFLRRNCVAVNWDWAAAARIGWFLFGIFVSNLVASIHGKKEKSLRNSRLNFT